MSEEDFNNNGRASHYVPNCRTLRVGAGKSINVLAKHSDVDRGTIAKIERNHPVSEPVAHRIFSTLNGWHGEKLEIHKEITNIPKK